MSSLSGFFFSLSLSPDCSSIFICSFIDLSLFIYSFYGRPFFSLSVVKICVVVVLVYFDWTTTFISHLTLNEAHPNHPSLISER